MFDLIAFESTPGLFGTAVTSGGDCARTLVESSAGGYEPPFPVNGAKRRLV